MFKDVEKRRKRQKMNKERRGRRTQEEEALPFERRADIQKLPGQTKVLVHFLSAKSMI